MFNAQVFVQVLMVLFLLALVYVGSYTVIRHTWLPAKIIAGCIAIVALAAAVGVVCA